LSNCPLFQIFYNFRDLFTELQRLDVIPSAGSASRRTILARFYERRMKAQRAVCHQLVVIDAPHATGRSTVTFVSHELLLRILALEHLKGVTVAQLAKVQPLLDLIGQLALQPQGGEAEGGKADGESGGGGDEDEEDSKQDDDEDDGGPVAAAASASRRRQPQRSRPLHRPRDDESSSSETDSSSDGDDEGDGAYRPRAARPAAAAGASASVQRAADAAFSDLVRVPSGIVWRGIAIDAYRHKGQGQVRRFSSHRSGCTAQLQRSKLRGS